MAALIRTMILLNLAVLNFPYRVARRIPAWTLRWLLVPATAPLMAAPSNETNTWKKYHVLIPHFSLEYEVPPGLTPGLRGPRHETEFDNLGKDQSASRFGSAAHQKSIATYFYGVVGDFRDFDMTVEVFVIKFDRAQNGMKSVADLAEYVRNISSRKYVLKSGEEISYWGDVTSEKIAARDVVVASAKDMYHIANAALQDGAMITLRPHKRYFIRLDDEVVVGINVLHHSQKRLTPQWHANADALTVSIIEHLRFSPRSAERS